MESLVVVVHVIVAIAIVGLVLLQQGKGADAGASFGAGASQTVFGSSGTGNFLVRATTVAATVFFVTSLALAIYARDQSGLSTTTGLPVVNPDILEEVTAQQSDLPVLEEEDPVSTQSDLPVLQEEDPASTQSGQPVLQEENPTSTQSDLSALEEEPVSTPGDVPGLPDNN